MKYYILCIVSLMTGLLFSVVAVAQEKVPDMSRFSKAPIKPGVEHAAARKQLNRTAAVLPVKPGGGERGTVTRHAAKPVVATPATLPSGEATAVKQQGKAKVVTPVIPETIREQLNMKPVAAPVKVSALKPAAGKS